MNALNECDRYILVILVNFLFSTVILVESYPIWIQDRQTTLLMIETLSFITEESSGKLGRFMLEIALVLKGLELVSRVCMVAEL